MAKLTLSEENPVCAADRSRASDWPEPVASDGSRPPGARVMVGALPLDAVGFDEAVAWTIAYIRHRGQRPPARIACPNASLVSLADADPGFAKIIAHSNLVVADGLPLLWAARLLGTPLPAQIRGVDLMERLCAAGAAHGMSLYILGGLPDAAEIAARRLVNRYPGLRFAGSQCPPLGFESDSSVNLQVRETIAAAAPDLLIVALGSPKQEWWISRNCLDLPIGAIQGVGAAIDTYAGLRERPPEWMRNLGLEWFGRLLAEPRRLWRRYVFGNTRFLWVVFRQWLKARRP
jgi:N-acetylglucosaminyldiphosphoundecaprenol N-acetyl-beta-D-mannosaminyltransferase